MPATNRVRQKVTKKERKGAAQGACFLVLLAVSLPVPLEELCFTMLSTAEIAAMMNDLATNRMLPRWRLLL